MFSASVTVEPKAIARKESDSFTPKSYETGLDAVCISRPGGMFFSRDRLFRSDSQDFDTTLVQVEKPNHVLPRQPVRSRARVSLTV